MTPYHVDRAKLFIDERFGGHRLIDAEVIKRNIELTRFPVPKESDHQDTINFPGLVRAADLIGQLSDPRYQSKKLVPFTMNLRKLGLTKKWDIKIPAIYGLTIPSFTGREFTLM